MTKYSTILTFYSYVTIEEQLTWAICIVAIETGVAVAMKVAVTCTQTVCYLSKQSPKNEKPDRQHPVEYWSIHRLKQTQESKWKLSTQTEKALCKRMASRFKIYCFLFFYKLFSDYPFIPSRLYFISSVWLFQSLSFDSYSWLGCCGSSAPPSLHLSPGKNRPIFYYIPPTPSGI